MADRAIWSDMIGAPWKLGGRSLRDGIDCLGVLQEYYSRRGVYVPDPFPSYHDDTVRVSGKAAAAFGALWAPADGTRVGDVCVIKNGDGERMLHCGILVAPGRILHAIMNVGVAMTSIELYRQKIIGWYRVADE